VVEAALGEAGVTLDDVEAVAATAGPGLIGALLVGISTAKAIAAARRLPLIPVDHLQGHVAANFLEPEPLEPPFLCLVASGGHTLLAGVRDHVGYELLGQTLDDAAGEAFDKSARLLGLGYPGGPAVQREAEKGDPEAFEMPVAMSRNPGLDFSFSGLKTAVLYRCRELGPEGVEEHRADLAASFQAAVVEQLTAKLKRALKKGEWDAVALGGGVAANGPLREAVGRLCEEMGVRLKLVPISLCTDNAAMIGSAARYAEPIPYPDYLGYDAFATGEAGAPAVAH
jgi:N6-L-threonylcarbamoyladenine synthase